MIEIRNPHAGCYLEPFMLGEPTWAEKQRSKLIWKMKKVKVVINLLFFIPILITQTFIIVLGIGWISVRVNHVAFEHLLGFVARILIIGSSVILADLLPCNPRNVRVKHRGKYVW